MKNFNEINAEELIGGTAVFVDLGITDAITDKHRDYPASFVLPVQPLTGSRGASAGDNAVSDDVYSQLDKLGDLRERGIITEEEFQTEKKLLLDRSEPEEAGVEKE